MLNKLEISIIFIYIGEAMKSLKNLICSLIFVLSATVFAESRNALLIANAKYENFGSLTTPIKEARDLKKTLETLGFSVTIIENASLDTMQDAIDTFSSKLQNQGGIGFFHYGGHAVQMNGENYLIPCNAAIPDEKKVKTRALCVDDVMASMNAETNIVVLDACRNNPLPSSIGRSANRGLVLTVEHPKNSIIIYSAQPGNVAQDGVFTPILTKKLLEKKELGSILRDVRREVNQITKGQQNPGSYDELTSEVYLAGYVTNEQNTIVEKKPSIAIVEKPMPLVNNQTIDSLLLGAKMIDIPNKNYQMMNTEVTQKLYKSIMGENPSYFKADDLPVENVSWYDAIYFCNKLSEKCGLTSVYAVDGKTYVDSWKYTPHKSDSIKGVITQNTKANGFRLPTNDEWEYAAKGGQKYSYAGSNSIDLVAWYDGNSGSKTHSVSKKQANDYGIYDMSGNVWEWVWDSYNNYRYACGGSWYSVDYCRIDSKERNYAYNQRSYLGFRTVRSR